MLTDADLQTKQLACASISAESMANLQNISPGACDLWHCSLRSPVCKSLIVDLQWYTCVTETVSGDYYALSLHACCDKTLLLMRTHESQNKVSALFGILS
jgi:hypothetical protein